LAPWAPIPAIKLKRTDTTLDLSLMAKEAGEKESSKWEGESDVFVAGEGCASGC
jgi:hypothetical protein